jgi:integrase
MPPRLLVAASQQRLVEAYLADRARAGGGLRQASIAARRFLVGLGSPDGWHRLTLAEQRRLPEHVRAFVCWLMVSGRLRATPEYVVLAQPKLGLVGGWTHPAVRERLASAADLLGYGAETQRLAWSALMRTVALTGVAPQKVRQKHLDEAHAAIEAVQHRLAPRKPRPRKDHNGVHLAVQDGFRPIEMLLFHGGLSDEPPRGQPGKNVAPAISREWEAIAEPMRSTMLGYLDQVRLTSRPSTVKRDSRALRDLGMFLAKHAPTVAAVADIRRTHIEAYKKYLSGRRHHHRSPDVVGLSPVTVVNYLSGLSVFFDRLIEWGSPDAPAGPLLFRGDYPAVDDPLPRFLDDPAAAKLMRAARNHPDLLTRLVVELLARTGMRKSELLGLRLDAVVQIGSAYWLRIPVGKLRNDRYVPLHPDLKALIDTWLAKRRGLRSDLLLLNRGRALTASVVDRMLSTLAEQAGIGHVTAHQLRHTLGTQAVNRGMSLDAIAMLLGHRDLSMTKVYARIGDRTVADQYFAVTEKVVALYSPPGPQPASLPADAEGNEMRRLRAEMGRRMLGNGYCARPVDMDCHFETVCESCTFFVTTIEFRPTLERQRDDAAAKGQVARTKIFDGLLHRLDNQAS